MRESKVERIQGVIVNKMMAGLLIGLAMFPVCRAVAAGADKTATASPIAQSAVPAVSAAGTEQVANMEQCRLAFDSFI
jgi:hypothetical protein